MSAVDQQLSAPVAISAHPNPVGNRQMNPDADCCWVCLDHGSDDRPLIKPCKCPRSVHSDCLGRWQLHSAGKQEERQCRFCFTFFDQTWEQALAPGEASSDADDEPILAAVVWNNKVHKIPVKRGPEGIAEFKRKVQQLFQLPQTLNFDVSFEAPSPTGDKLQLHGFNSFEAATRCAALSRQHAATSFRVGSAPN